MVGALFLGALGLLAAGCAASQKRDPESPSQSAEDSLNRELREDPKGQWTYEQLRQRGVSPSSLDQGCHTIDYSRAGPNETLSGKGDGKIHTCEAYEYAFDRYEEYREIVEGVMSGPIPWELDDHNPNTDFDEKIRAQVRKAVVELELLLFRGGLNRENTEFQEKMAVGLFYFTYFPDRPDAIQQNQEYLRFRTQELDRAGLAPFRDYLFQKGGLGIAFMLEDAAMEATALDALRMKKGYCTEESNILYAVYRMAGLRPFFVFHRSKDMRAYQKEILHSLLNTADSHVEIGLRLGTKTRYFDATNVISDSQFPNPYHLPLKSYAAVILSNRSVGYFMRDSKQSLPLIRNAIRLDPEQPIYYSNYGGYLREQEKDLWRAEAAFKKALSLGTQESHHYFLLGLLYLEEPAFEKEKLDETIALFQKSVKLDPDLPKPHFYLGLALGMKERAEDSTLITHFQKAAELDPQYPEPLYALGILHYVKKRPTQSIPFLRKAIELDPEHRLAPSARQILSEIERK